MKSSRSCHKRGDVYAPSLELSTPRARVIFIRNANVFLSLRVHFTSADMSMHQAWCHPLHVHENCPPYGRGDRPFVKFENLRLFEIRTFPLCNWGRHLMLSTSVVNLATSKSRWLLLFTRPLRSRTSPTCHNWFSYLLATLLLSPPTAT